MRQLIRSDCLCQKKSLFSPIIIYQNESVFKNYNGIIIGCCQNCGLLKTVTCPKKAFGAATTHFDFYEKNKKLFAEIYRPMIREIKKIKKGGSILDVGCSSAIMLTMLQKEGFKVFGIEPNHKAYQQAAKKLPKKIYPGHLADFFQKHHQKKFDLVIYNHVFEHINKLNEEIDLIKKVLKKDGLLVIGVPNYRNLIFFVRKKFWESLLPKEHIWHFSDKYLLKFLETRGFKTIKLSYSNDKRLDYPLIKRVYFGLLSLINKLLKTGESVVVYAKYI
jgi:SAM-dependent methyltransferase